MAGYKGGKSRNTRGGSSTGRGKNTTPSNSGGDKPELAFFAKVKDDDEEYGYATVGAVRRWADTGYLVLDINLNVAEKYVNERGYIDGIKLFEYDGKNG